MARRMTTPPPALETDPTLRRALTRYRRVATALLALMAGLILLSYALPPGWWAELLQASAKAGFVGGIADWFAVTALFRYPLGLPIPHTAIIPRQKARLGRALGRFVAGHVITAGEVSRVLGRFDLAAVLGRYLSNPAHAGPAAQELARLLPRLLATVEDGRARRTLARLVPRMVGGRGAGQVVARALRTLVEGGRHQEVLTFALGELRALLDARQPQLQEFVENKVRAQGGRLVGWALGAQVAARVLSVLRDELERVGPDDSSLRAAFDVWVRDEITRMEADPERAAEMGRAIRRVVAHETVQAWLWDVWSRLRAALEADAAAPGGRTQAVLEGALANFGTFLAQDEGARARLQAFVADLVVRLLPELRGEVEGFIGNVVGNWDAATITEKVELRVGPDLQYVRINGTLVGFLVGGALYVVLQAVFGRVSF